METIKRGYGIERYALGVEWEKKIPKKLNEKILYPRGYLRPTEILEVLKHSS